jgi:site-specific DNA-methyltransferase (adenine-specific)
MIQKKDLPKEIRKYFKYKETKTIKVKGYISHLCDIFDEVKRVLSPYGSVWVNLGDKYINGNLQSVPHRFAIEMGKRGWILKSTIIWHKPSAPPTGDKKKFCNDFEYFFFFVKDKKKYYFDMQFEPFAESTKKLKSSKKNTNWIKKVHSGKQTGRHQRTTWLYKPTFYKLKDDFEERPEVLKRLKELKLI